MVVYGNILLKNYSDTKGNKVVDIIDWWYEKHNTLLHKYDDLLEVVIYLFVQRQPKCTKSDILLFLRGVGVEDEDFFRHLHYGLEYKLLEEVDDGLYIVKDGLF